MAKVKELNPDLQDKEPQMSQEEMARRREEITKFYKFVRKNSKTYTVYNDGSISSNSFTWSYLSFCRQCFGLVR